jgi:ornithine cyclodeaminase
MKTLVINQSQVSELLPMAECIPLMSDALAMLTRGNAINPLRHGLWLPERVGILGMMPAYLADSQTMGVKTVSVFPGNEGTEFDVHQGAVLLFEVSHGRLIAIVEASEITAIRTAAVSGVATKLLARKDATDLAILGSGVQARTHLSAMRLSRDIHRIRVWSRTVEHAQRFAQRESDRHGVQVEAVTEAREAVDGASIICTTTAAQEPVLQGDWLAPGTHINAIGSSVRFARELDTVAVVKSSLFVDRRESTINEAGEFVLAREERVIQEDHIQSELGEILTKQHPGRESEDEITLFKGLGLGIEDVASAQHVYGKAVEEGVGTWVELGAVRNGDGRD